MARFGLTVPNFLPTIPNTSISIACRGNRCSGFTGPICNTPTNRTKYISSNINTLIHNQSINMNIFNKNLTNNLELFNDYCYQIGCNKAKIGDNICQANCIYANCINIKDELENDCQYWINCLQTTQYIINDNNNNNNDYIQTTCVEQFKNVDWIMMTLTSEGKHRVQWTAQNQLEDLDFADNLALLSYTQMKTPDIAAASALVGLSIHRGKGKILKYKRERTPTKSRLTEKLWNRWNLSRTCASKSINKEDLIQM
ncbi:unnamed protein product [Schistosoma mattheei]|uniref:Uncharacterized protein n=1 Tax=Schistosoma mattheei TaxID=31246 RepID=A0A183Q080_9TREM|nr:unnamed protein product [Schistosoma mattheei]